LAIPITGKMPPRVTKESFQEMKKMISMLTIMKIMHLTNIEMLVLKPF
jgi:hypothetical protein